MIKSKVDPTDAIAVGPSKMVAPTKTATSYNEPGLPTPPAGWGRNIGTDSEAGPGTRETNEGE